MINAGCVGRSQGVRITMMIYQLKVTLEGVRPPIWRRIQVKGDTKLGKLHDILQDVMGWTDSHLHDFRVGDARYMASPIRNTTTV